MGLYKQETCIFTGLMTEPINDSIDAIEYTVVINGKTHLICLPNHAIRWENEEPFFKKNKYIFNALLFNGIWFENERDYIDLVKLKKLLDQADYPKNPSQKLEKLFINLCSIQSEEGSEHDIDNDYYDNVLWKILYFKSVRELNFYVEHLDQIGLIEATFCKTKSNRMGLLESYKITYEGLNKAIELQENGKHSDLCFIAMSFRSEAKPIRDAIKNALNQTGFRPIIIDEENIDSDKTINDAIIANLKKCNFCIADFSFHSSGVYFESGFALGQGKKVIYTCREDEFNKAHFDIKPLQHIIYKDVDELKNALVNKIEAWIK